jgi:hypothetical protein
MRKYTLLVLIILTAIVNNSCVVTYGDSTRGEYTAIQEYNSIEKDSSIYLFYNGEQLDFQYRKIGEVESEGSEYASNTEVLNYLKYKAWENGANGLINIKSDYKNREQGVLFNSESEDIYNSKYYSAIAVKIAVDSAFLAKYGNGTDTTFVTEVKNYRSKQGQRTSNQIVTSFLGGILGVILVIIAVSAS